MELVAQFLSYVLDLLVTVEGQRFLMSIKMRPPRTLGLENLQWWALSDT